MPYKPPVNGKRMCNWLIQRDLSREECIRLSASNIHAEMSAVEVSKQTYLQIK